MRILYAIVGYGEKHMGGLIHREMALAMIARGHAYEIVAPEAGGAPSSESADPYDDGVTVHRLVSAGSPGLDLVNRLGEPVFHFSWFPIFAMRLARFLRARPRYDVIIAEGAYPLGAATWLATRGTGVPFVVTVAGGDFLANAEASYGYARYRVPRSLMRAAFRSAAVVRAIAPYAGERAVALGCPPERLALVPRNIAETTFLPAGVARADFRAACRRNLVERLGLDASPVIATVGRLLPIKGFDHLIRALPEIIASVGAVQLVHVGPNRDDPRIGDYRGYLEGLAESLGVRQSLTFAGPLPLEGVREALAAAAVAVVPSLEEGGNKTMIEAAAVGTPFVATRTSGNAGWALGWNCGVVIEPASPGALARGITDLLKDRPRAGLMGENGLAFAEAFRTGHVAARMLALCRLAADGAAVPPEMRAPLELLNPAPGVRR